MAERVQLFKCPKCNNHFQEEWKADKCCAPKFCEDCKKELPHKWYKTICSSCDEKRVISKARTMTYDEYCAEFPDNYLVAGDSFYPNMEEIIDHYDGEEMPSYAFGTIENIHTIDIDSAAENALEDAYEEAEFDNMDELRDFVEKWNERNAVTSYSENNKVIVLIPESEDSNA